MMIFRKSWWMPTTILWVLMLACFLNLFPEAALADIDESSCSKTVIDDVGALGKQLAQVEAANTQLISVGADAHVVVVGQTANLDFDENKLEVLCRSWQSPNGGRKSTLIALMVSPRGRRMGLYYGSAWNKALDGHWNRIKQDYMAPRFASGDFAGGFISAEQQLSARILASRDESIHPAVSTSTTVNQAADYSGLWEAFRILLGIICLGGFFGSVYFLLTRKRRLRELIDSAQQRATIARNSCADKIIRYKDEITPLNEKTYGLASENFSRLMKSEKTNPDTDSLTASQYDDIEQLYLNISTMLDQAVRPTEAQQRFPVSSRSSPSWSQETAVKEPIAHTAAASPSHHRHHQSSTIIAPVTIFNEESERPYSPPPVETSAPAPSCEPPSSSDSGGGGSSSWSDSSSSSSDSGGGGSSDFGSSGGSDSGSGGGGSGF